MQCDYALQSGKEKIGLNKQSNKRYFVRQHGLYLVLANEEHQMKPVLETQALR